VKITIAGPDDASDEPYIQAVYDAIDRKVAGIMIIAWGDGDVVLAVDTAVDMGIPVVTTDSDIPTSARLAHVGTDWFRMGTAMANTLGDLIDHRGKVLMIGILELANMQTGFQGFRQWMKLYPKIEVLGPEDDLAVSTEKATDVVALYLKEHPDLAGVAGFDGNSGPGAAIALEKAGKQNDVRLVCVDADELQIKHIMTGAIDVAFCQKREIFTYLAFQMLHSYNHGSAATGYRPGLINIPGNIDTGNIPVTLDNLDTFESELNLDAYAELHEAEQKLRLINDIVDHCIEIAIAADRDGQIVYANPAALDLFGYKETEIASKSIFDLFDFSDEQQESAMDSLAAGKPCSLETTAMHGSGEAFPVQLSMSPAGSAQGTRGIVLVAMDISECRKAEFESRLKKRELEDAIAARKDLLSMVSHELKSPLVPILGYSELLMDGSLGKLSDKSLDAVRTIHERAQAMEKLINDLMALSKIELNALRINTEPVKIQEFLGAVVDSYSQLNHGKDVNVRLSGDDFTIEVDPDRLRQIISNLIDNAILYSSDAVTIDVSTIVENERGVISIADNGIGIPPDQVDHVFEKFFRVWHEKAPDIEGSGLGLAIVKDLVEIMDGTVSVASALLKGSTFTISFKLK
jgi:ribose transport system substrate-binding protein